MTEAEWNASEDPAAMLAAVSETARDQPDRTFYGQAPYKASDRKLRLFACACARAHSWQPTDDLNQQIAFIGKVEQWVDGGEYIAGYNLWNGIAILASNRAIEAAVYWATSDDTEETNHLPNRAALLREVVGNPFRSGNVLDVADCTTRAWCEARAMALLIYRERNFTDLSVLADAQEDAGCESLALLKHLRSPGPHVRGCWALDCVLGRE